MRGFPPKGWFPLSLNFYVHACIKFRFANKIDALKGYM